MYGIVDFPTKGASPGLADGIFGAAPGSSGRLLAAPLLRMMHQFFFLITQCVFLYPKSPYYYGGL
jgi:hypothetical protein